MSRPTPVDPALYRRIALRAHALLEDVPIHDVWRLDLPGGGEGRTLDDVLEPIRGEAIARVNPVVGFLFVFRAWLGRTFGWDDAPESGSGPAGASRLDAVPADLLEASTLRPGSREGPFTVLYATDREAVGEVQNATVHAFSVHALVPVENGYALYWAIHVASVSPMTPFYMALIAPFRRFLVYPAILGAIAGSWRARFGEAG